jgi:hypothetical protein
MLETRAVSSGCGDLHLSVQLAGTPQQLGWLIGRCYATPYPLPGFTGLHMLGADLALIGGYTTVFTLLIIAGWWRFEAHVLRRCWWVIALPAAAAVADLIEDLLLYSVVIKGGDGKLTYRNPVLAQWFLVTAAWTKWMLLFASACALVMALAVLLVRFRQNFPPARVGEDLDGLDVSRHTNDPGLWVDLRRVVETPAATDEERAQIDPELATPNPEGPPPAPSPTSNGVVGVCLSGGGIRAMSFALGVLQTLDDAPTEVGATTVESPLRKARYLSAVSGGSWAATAWTLQKLTQRNTNAADTVIAALQADAPSGYQRHKYMMNGRGGVLGPLWWVLLCAFVNLSGIAAIVYLVSWPLGYFQTFCAVSAPAPDSALRCGTGGEHDVNNLRFLESSAALAVLGLIVLIICGFGYRRRARKWPLGAVLLVLAGFTLFYLIALRWVFVHAANGTLTATTLGVLGSAMGASGVITVGGGIWKVLGAPLTKQVSERVGRLLPKLLGLVLLLGVLAWALVAMYFAAIGSLKPWTWLAAAGWIISTLLLFSPNWPTLHNIYSARLRRSFDPSAGQPFQMPISNTDPEERHSVASSSVTWGDLADMTRTQRAPDNIVPELILCCAQQRHGLAPGGLRADTFTISPHWVRQGHRSLPNAEYLKRAKPEKWRARLNRIDVEHVSSWMATSGAAVASAMGRSSLGTTNALMAAINADLGVWLPNLRLVQSHPDYVFRRPTFGHLGKEIFGLYGTHDRYVFITDGGHWDNLGIVELLRRRCDEIYCVDASADPPYSFATLRQALTLASLELEQDLDVDFTKVLTYLKPENDDDILPRTNVTTFEIELADCTAPPLDGDHPRPRRRVTIHYLKLQASQDMGINLRRYAIADPKFPRYSTAQQLLTPQQFANLVEAGKEAGTKLMKRRAAAEAARERSTRSDQSPSGIAQQPTREATMSGPGIRSFFVTLNDRWRAARTPSA